MSYSKTPESSNTAARITLRMPRTEHTPLLRMLHWLPIPNRTAYKIDSLCYTALTTAYPKYLSELLNVYTPARPLLIIGSKYPQHCRSKDKVIWTMSICLAGPINWNRVLAALKLWKKRTHSKDI